MTLGNDITCRLALATTAHSGWFYSSIHGVFGTAAACARLLGLDAGQAAHALGIALSLVGGTQQPMVERSLIQAPAIGVRSPGRGAGRAVGR